MALIKHILKVPGAWRLWRTFPVGSVPLRTQFDIWPRPSYAYGVYAAAELATKLGLGSISVLEFGVAAGAGLLALEDIALRFEKHFKIQISVVGFDTGSGMPKPDDYRDLPYVWGESFYKMDEEKLRRRLRGADLILADVEKGVERFLADGIKGPIGFVAFDLDYYSSTKKALRIFEGPVEGRLPRVFCYFDDVIWPERACYCEYTGELLAINEFNSEHSEKKLCNVPHLSWIRPRRNAWNEQIYVMHDFRHPLYGKNITPMDGRQHPL